MKFYTVFLCLLLVFISCKAENRNQENVLDIEAERKENSDISDVNPTNSDSEVSYKVSKEDSPGNNSSNKQESSQAITSGTTYVKTNETDANCSCYCLELAMNNNFEFLLEDEIYINARYSKVENDINIYFTSPSTKNKNEELPWKDFDTNTPLAVLSPGESGALDLDWKGFSVEGGLAMDPAIYGKRTFEGTYKKQ